MFALGVFFSDGVGQRWERHIPFGAQRFAHFLARGRRRGGLVCSRIGCGSFLVSILFTHNTQKGAVARPSGRACSSALAYARATAPNDHLNTRPTKMSVVS